MGARRIRKRLIMGRAALVALLAAPVVGTPAAAAQNQQKPDDSATVCARTIANVEGVVGLPPHILDAIALVESGRQIAGLTEKIAWPWTIHAEGKGRYFPTKAQAVAAVRRLRKRGVSNIDVGCMQINLRHHSTAFANLDDAFDPATNVIYATRFLIRLYAETRSWGKAVALYHSRTRKLYLPYRARVFRAWSARSGLRLATLAAQHLDGAERATVGPWRRVLRRPGAVSGAVPGGARLVQMTGRGMLFAPPPQIIRGASKAKRVHAILQEANAQDSQRNYVVNRYLRARRTDKRKRKTYAYAPALRRRMKQRKAANAGTKPRSRLYYQRGAVAKTYWIAPYRKR